jgi:hypothetical protein
MRGGQAKDAPGREICYDATMMTTRVSWLVALIAAVLTLATPTLRQQLRLQQQAGALPPAGFRPPEWLSPEPREDTDLWESGSLDVWWEWAHVEGDWISRLTDSWTKRVASDATSTRNALLEAALQPGTDLTPGGDALQAAALSSPEPFVRSAATRALLSGVSYGRIELLIIDPSDPERIARARREVAESPSLLDNSLDGAPQLLRALHRWRQADPQNGLPLAVEAWLLFGLHRDQEAVQRWLEASRCQVMSTRAAETHAAARKALERAGAAEPEAGLVALSSDFSLDGFGSPLREAARAFQYEGLLACMQGRQADAARIWQATTDIASKFVAGSDSDIECLLGIAVLGVGISPAWHWYPGRVTGTPEGPLMGGRVFPGSHHATYLSQMGSQADRLARDTLLQAKVRSSMLRDYSRLRMADTRYGRAMFLLSLNALILAQILVLLAAFCFASVRGRRQADAASQLSGLWSTLIAAAAALPVASFGIYSAAAVTYAHAPAAVAWLIPYVPLALALSLTLVAAPFRRVGIRRALMAWRGSLRRVLPPAVALLAVAFLVTGALAAQGRAAENASWKQAGWTEMGRLVRHFGDRWEHPTIPQDAWRDEQPQIGQ